MNVLSGILSAVDSYENNQESLSALISGLEGAMWLMPDSCAEKEALFSEWWTIEIEYASMLNRGDLTLPKEYDAFVKEAIKNIRAIVEKLAAQEKVSFVNDTTALYTSYCKWELSIHMDKYPDGVILDSDTIKSWEPPHQCEIISDSQKAEIQKRISDYLDKKGIIHGWI